MTDDPTGRRLPAWLALWIAAWLVYLSMQPFVWVGEWSDVLAHWSRGLRAATLERLPQQVLGAALLGWCVGAMPMRRRVVVAAFVFCVALELSQGTVEHRHPRIGDLGLRWIGLAIGIVAGRRLPAPRAVLVARLLVVVVPLALGFWTFDKIRRTSLTNWDPSFAFAIGDELTGDRPWEGCIAGLALYDRALGPGDAAELMALRFGAADAAPRESLGAIAVYEFTNDGPQPRLQVGDGLPLSWQPVAGKRAAGQGEGLCIGVDDRLRSPAPPTFVTRALSRRSEFSVELQCRTRSPWQRGPARIVSLSRDPHARNFTIGQEFSDLMIRVRSVQNGLDGNLNEHYWHGVFADQTASHLVLSYRRGRTTLYWDGVPMRAARQLRPTVDAVLDLTTRPFVIAGLILVPVGLLVPLGWPRPGGRWRRRLVAGVGVGGAVLAGELLGMAIGARLDPTVALLALLLVPASDASLP